jgi:putative chitobiose transport system substrate-binding protein
LKRQSAQFYSLLEDEMNVKKAFGLTLALAAGAAGLSLSQVGAQQKLQLEFVTTSLQPFADYFNPLVERYNGANAAQNLKWTDLPQAAIQQKILTGIASGNSPDAVQMNNSQIIELAQQGALQPLNTLLDKKVLDSYQKAALAAFTFEGKVYGLPDYASPRIVLFNTEILKKAGLDASNLPRTQGGIIAWAKQIREKTGAFGFSPLIDSANMLKVFQEEGLPVLSADRKKAVFNSPAHIGLLQRYIALRKADVFPEDTMKGIGAAFNLYTAGKLGICVVGITFVPRLEKDANAIYKTTVVGQSPIAAGQVVQASTFAYAVPTGTKDPKASAALAAWLTNDAQQLAFAKRVGTVFPTTIQAARDPYFSSGKGSTNLTDLGRYVGSLSMKNAKELNPIVPNASTLNKAVKDNIEAAIFGQKTAKQALDDTVAIWNANL